MNDVEDGLQYVIEQGWVDAEKVAIYGASHGGYAVLRGLTKTPELYSCGIDYVGVSNLYTFMQSMPAYWKPYLEIIKAIWYDEDNAEEKKIMDEVSPVFHIDKITKPLFVIQFKTFILGVPINSATNKFLGLLNNSRGEPT